MDMNERDGGHDHEASPLVTTQTTSQQSHHVRRETTSNNTRARPRYVAMTTRATTDPSTPARYPASYRIHPPAATHLHAPPCTYPPVYYQDDGCRSFWLSSTVRFLSDTGAIITYYVAGSLMGYQHGCIVAGCVVSWMGDGRVRRDGMLG